jgi:hypothetical protein
LCLLMTCLSLTLRRAYSGRNGSLRPFVVEWSAHYAFFSMRQHRFPFSDGMPIRLSENIYIYYYL